MVVRDKIQTTEKVAPLPESRFIQTNFWVRPGALASHRTAVRTDHFLSFADIAPPQRVERDFVGAIHESPGGAGA